MSSTALPRRRFTTLLALGAACCIATPAMADFWNSKKVEGNGRIQTQTRALGSFHGVAMSLPGNVEVRMGGSESVSIETDENLLPLIETVVENGILQIRPSRKNINLSSRHMILVVQAKNVDQLSLGGSGNIQAGLVKGAKASLDIGGSGNITVKNVEADALSVDIGGSGELKVGGGRASKLSVSIAGSGNADLGTLQSTSASASIAGSGNATFAVRDHLDVSIVGSGNVNYYGDPRVSRSVMGSGTATRAGARR